MKEEAEAAVETAKGVLQDLVVVVSLVRTLTDSFGSASDLYRKLKRKAGSESHSGDDAKEDRTKRRRRYSHFRRDSGSDSDRKPARHHIRWKLGSKTEDYSDSDEELICTSSSQVTKAYDRGYQKLGEGFARGDLVAQNQLQAQIIQLQSTLLSIHQDYMLSSYMTPSSSHSHLVRIIQTTRSARAASVQALHMQYQRMLAADSHMADTYPNMPGAFQLPPHKSTRHDSVTRKERSRSRNRERSKSPDRAKRPGTITIQPYPNPHHPKPHPPTNKLFCVYARDLQAQARLPLTDNYKAGGDNMCPFCHAHVSTRPGKAWEVIADDCKTGGVHKRRVFLVKNRFVIKCHREGTGFACFLCARFKDSDTTCRTVGALMDHLWRDHEAGDLERDDDILEVNE